VVGIVAAWLSHGITVKHQKLRSQVKIIIETDDASMKLCELIITKIFNSCRMQSAKLFVGKSVTAPALGSW